MTFITQQGLASPLIITQGYGIGASARGCVHAYDNALYSVTAYDNSCSAVASIMAYNTHDLGDLVRLSTFDADHPDDGFMDENLETLMDPDVVKLNIRSPAGTVTTLTYGTDAIIKDAAGQYHYDMSADESGEWRYRWWSTGNGQAAEERRFMVRRALAV